MLECLDETFDTTNESSNDVDYCHFDLSMHYRSDQLNQKIEQHVDELIHQPLSKEQAVIDYWKAISTLEDTPMKEMEKGFKKCIRDKVQEKDLHPIMQMIGETVLYLVLRKDQVTLEKLNTIHHSLQNYYSQLLSEHQLCCIPMTNFRHNWKYFTFGLYHPTHHYHCDRLLRVLDTQSNLELGQGKSSICMERFLLEQVMVLAKIMKQLKPFLFNQKAEVFPHQKDFLDYLHSIFIFTFKFTHGEKLLCGESKACVRAWKNEQCRLNDWIRQRTVFIYRQLQNDAFLLLKRYTLVNDSDLFNNATLQELLIQLNNRCYTLYAMSKLCTLETLEFLFARISI